MNMLTSRNVIIAAVMLFTASAVAAVLLLITMDNGDGVKQSANTNRGDGNWDKDS